MPRTPEGLDGEKQNQQLKLMVDIDKFDQIHSLIINHLTFIEAEAYEEESPRISPKFGGRKRRIHDRLGR